MASTGYTGSKSRAEQDGSSAERRCGGNVEGLQTRAESRKRTKHSKGLCSLLPSRWRCDEGEGQSVIQTDERWDCGLVIVAA